MTNHLYLIRHGETDWNRLNRIQGHYDIPLNEMGRMQARRIAARMSQLPVHYIYSSDLSRARDTAAEIAKIHQVPHRLSPELRERNYGEWEGLHWDEIRRRFAGSERSQDVGGKYGIETIDEMQQRGMAKIKELIQSHPGCHIAIVSHGGMINALLHAWSGGEYGTGITKLGNTSFTHILYEDGKWLIHTVNDISHLEDD